MPVSVSRPREKSRLAMPIHQFGTTNSLPPRGPPWRLNSAKTMPSCMNCQPPALRGNRFVLRTWRGLPDDRSAERKKRGHCE